MKKKTTKAKAVKRKKSAVKKDVRSQEMKIGNRIYTVGEEGWAVNESTQLKYPRPIQCVITGVYPVDSIEPALGIREYQGPHRTIRARLIGLTKKEAQDNYASFIKSEEKKSRKTEKTEKTEKK
jgi:hypothetical protein